MTRSLPHGPASGPSGSDALAALADEVRRCRLCVTHPRGAPLPHDPRPVLRPSATARILVAGQAPGARVHASGVPFTDPSGDRLRDWMGVSPDDFYDTRRIAILPMGFCFPGHDAKGGDRPPRRECADAWRSRLVERMPQIEFVLAIGHHAQRWHLGALCRSTLTETVADWRAILDRGSRPRVLPLPHPSWRNNRWLADNPWFAADLLPVLRDWVARLQGSAGGGPTS